MKGFFLWTILHEFGLKEPVRRLTFEADLLDLVLANITGVNWDDAAGVADHPAVLTRMGLFLPRSRVVRREVMDFAFADLGCIEYSLNIVLLCVDWVFLDVHGVDLATEQFTSFAMDTTMGHISLQLFKERNSTHVGVRCCARSCRSQT